MASRKSARKTSGAKSARPRAASKASKKGAAARPQMPDIIYANASPRSVGGVSMFEAQGQIDATTVHNFVSEESRSEAALEMLQQAGFDVLQVSEFSINIAAPRAVYERAFNTKLTIESRPTLKEQGREDLAEFIDCPETELPGLINTDGTPFQDVLEGVAIEEPRYFMGPSSFPPLQPYWHLHPPGDLAAALNAERAHRAGYTGRGIRIAMVDSGWFRHPYFTLRGYQAADAILGPGATNPLADESGHGTGESANIFAVAPDVQLLPVKVNFANTLGAFNAAVGLRPHIITCSWGSDNPTGPLSAADQALAAAIAAAVASGIIVIFSAGNGQFGFPGQHPDVISAGGTFMKPDETLMASDYASGFPSRIYPGRSVPDVCGLVGMRPRAIYIMLPVQPRDQIDVDLAGGTFPNGDQTANNDGWAAFSGTSAAAPQLAGVSALIKQACPRLGPFEVRDILMKTARDVVTGTCNPRPGMGFPARPGFDQATGAGLVDAHKATLVGKVRCLGVTPQVFPEQPAPTAESAQPMGFGVGPILPPILPIKPIKPPIIPIEPIKPQPIKPQPIIPIEPPITPIQPPIKPPIKPIKPPIFPIEPVKPIVPVKPISPVKPIVPVKPILPIKPIKPILPIKPIEPIINPGPIERSFESAAGEGESQSGGGGLSTQDAESIERMIIEDEFPNE